MPLCPGGSFLRIGIPTVAADAVEGFLLKYADPGTVWSLSEPYRGRRWMVTRVPNRSVFAMRDVLEPFPKMNLVQYLVKRHVNCVGYAVLSLRLDLRSDEEKKKYNFATTRRNTGQAKPLTTTLVDFVIDGTTHHCSLRTQFAQHNRLEKAVKRIHDLQMKRQAEREARERERRRIYMRPLSVIKEEEEEEE